MPRVNIYIREGDWELWQKIQDKPEWISGLLNAYSDKTIKPDTTNLYAEVEKILDDPNIKTASELFAEKTAPPILADIPLNRTCKKGHPANEKGRCHNMRCVYAL